MTEVKPAELIVFCFMLLHGFVAALNCTSPSPESLLNAFEKDLFPKKLMWPIKRFSGPINITISITLVGILGVNEKAQTLTTFLWQVLEWDIEGLSWDEKECGTNRISIPREKLWIPDVQISEFMDEDETRESPYVYIYNTGRVYDDKPLRVTSSCRLVIYTFPFDIQNCTLSFGPYLHFDLDMKIIQGATSEEILKESRQVIKTNGEWELVDIEVAPFTLELHEGNYSEIQYFIILRRRPTLYVVNLLIPSCFLVTLDVFSFLLPPHSVDRCAFKMTLILGYTVFLLIMNDLLPVTGYTTPLLNVSFSISFALMVASLLETIFITNIQFSSSRYGPVPHWIRVLVLRYIAIVVCLPKKKRSNRVTVSLHPPARDDNQANSSTEGDHICTLETREKEIGLLLSNCSFHGQAMDTGIIPTNDFQSISGNIPSVKPHLEPALDELRKLSNDLAAIRLQIEKHFEGSKTSREWYMVGIVIDRLLFGIYIVFILVSFITIVGIWIFSHLL